MQLFLPRGLAFSCAGLQLTFGVFSRSFYRCLTILTDGAIGGAAMPGGFVRMSIGNHGKAIGEGA
jgi:hypothetical protein